MSDEKQDVRAALRQLLGNNEKEIELMLGRYAGRGIQPDLHQAPVGLVGAEDVVAEDVGEQLDVAGFEQPRERVLLHCGTLTRG